MNRIVPLFTSLVITCVIAWPAYSQGPADGSSQHSREVLLESRIAALEKEVQSLRAQLEILHGQLRSGPSKKPVRPSNAQIQACVSRSRDELLSSLGPIVKFQFGSSFLAEENISSGTRIAKVTVFPATIHFKEGISRRLWVYVDSFGALQCAVVREHVGNM